MNNIFKLYVNGNKVEYSFKSECYSDIRFSINEVWINGEKINRNKNKFHRSYEWEKIKEHFGEKINKFIKIGLFIENN